MRLLNARTLEITTFVEKIPPYVILSHCWEEEEVVFADLANLTIARKRQGWEKIERTCEQAIQDGFDYVWIDTCCIDKSSSSELSEAINSMFAWYKNSEKCYAYLADVESPTQLASSKWFTRSWTLQELLAPSSIQTEQRVGMAFFSRRWIFLGDKGSLSKSISKITGIPKDYLEGLNLHEASISMRMSWAADRRATRAEDIAYSLLGLFDVNMPLLYGEGKAKAFRRLQEEIMKISEDETLFAWDSGEFVPDSATTDVLASDPKDFMDAKDLIPFASDDRVVPYALTHRGLRISLQLIKMNDFPEDSRDKLRNMLHPLRSPVMIWSGPQNLVWAVLRCHVAHDFQHSVIIPLRHLAADIYLRDASTNVALLPGNSVLFDEADYKPQDIYIRSRTQSIASSTRRRFGFLIRNLPEGFTIANAFPKESWDANDRILQGNYAESTGQSSWHASLQLSSHLPTTSDTALPTTRSMICLSLGCRRVTGVKEPKEWCHLDDTIWTHGGGSLEAFHGNVAGRPACLSVQQFKHGTTLRNDIQLRAFVFRKRVFGQDMFVVDIEHTKNQVDLRIPTNGSLAWTRDTSLSVTSADNQAVKRMALPEQNLFAATDSQPVKRIAIPERKLFGRGS